MYLTVAELLQRYRDGERDFHSANLTGANLTGTNLTRANLTGADLTRADLTPTTLTRANLTGATLTGTDLTGTDLTGADLTRADLTRAILSGTDLSGARLLHTIVKRAAFDEKTVLEHTLMEGVILDQVIFANANLITVQWGAVRMLGDEHRIKTAQDKQEASSVAARAYRTLSAALQAQGITDATRFHYRSLVMERKAQFYQAQELWRSLHYDVASFLFAVWFGSWLFGTLAGYGHYIWRLIVTYGILVGAFAVAYYVAAGKPLVFPPSLHNVVDVLVFSVTAFHGRGIQPPHIGAINDKMAAIAGVEAVFGLLVEGLFIATFARKVTGN